MNAQDRDRGPDRERRRAPRVESLEARDLPTFTLIHHAGAMSPALLASLQDRAAIQASAAGAVPTAHELRREQYVAKFKGTFLVGPGRFSDQAAQVYSAGSGSSNQAFHLTYQMRLTLPTDPRGPIKGVIALFPTNVATTGSTLILDLTGDPATVVRGLPTHYTWTVDPASSGLYTNAAGFGTGQGTLDIHFVPRGRGPHPASQSGTTTVAIHGLINTGGVFNNIGVPGDVPKQP